MMEAESMEALHVSYILEKEWIGPAYVVLPLGLFYR